MVEPITMAAALPMLAAFPLLVACRTDVRHRLIPDWSVLAIAAIGLVQALLLGTVAGALAAGGICLVLGTAAARGGLWGWGDAKLISAAGILAGLSGLPALLGGTAIAGGVLSAFLLLLRGPVRAGSIALPANAPRWLRAEHTRLRRAPTIPYALAIAAGLAAALQTGA
jgi:Flp pilus assembly protein protease CpaA